MGAIRRESRILLGAVIAGLFVGFQNCSPLDVRLAGRPGESSTSSNAEFFAYPYKEKPQFYTSIALYRPSGAQDGTHEFKFIGAAAPAEASGAAIDYRVEIRTPTGQTVCPEQTGRLNPGITSIQFDCVSTVETKSVRVTMTLTSDSLIETVEKTF